MAWPRHPTTLENLPRQVLSEIFIRLLAKQLAQMMCVCKPWNALLSESSFVKSHLHQSIHNNDEVLLFFPSGFSFDSSPFTARSTRSPGLELTNFIKLPVDLQSQNSKCVLIGSLHGLVCFYSGSCNDYFVIWNPSLSAISTLPPSSLPSCKAHVGFGFGFDPKTDDYKVVSVRRSREPNTVPQSEVYSMRKGSWESIPQSFPSCVTLRWWQNQVCLDGHVHLLGYIFKRNLETIVAFDLGAETFSEIPPPDSIMDYDVYKHYYVLGVLAGKLCVMARVKNGACEVWVMDEYGVAESWVKHNVFSQFISEEITPYGLTSHNEFLFQVDDNHFGLYDPIAAKTKTIKIKGRMGIFKVVEYVDSLVWIATRGP